MNVQASYAGLLRVRGIPHLITSALLARTSAQMWQVGIVLFALQQYHSAAVAGLGVGLLVFPGLVLSPVAGALLDRHGRRRLMAVDFLFGSCCLGAIVGLARLDALPVGALLIILTAGSLTSTLSAAGARSLFPLAVPRHLWDRANAADTLCYGVAQIGGPALAGALTAGFGAGSALLAAAVGLVLAAASLLGVAEPLPETDAQRSLLRESLGGLAYVMRNRTLRLLGVFTSFANVGLGILVVALPVVVFRLHGSAAVVGAVLAGEGLVGLPSTLLAGRLRSEGRERWMIGGGDAILGVLSLALLLPSLPVIGVAMAGAGAADGPASVGLYSLRQRRTDPAWFGRAFAVSMSLNMSGLPIGSAMAGPLVGVSVTLAVIVAAALPVLSGLSLVLLLPGPAAVAEANRSDTESSPPAVGARARLRP